MTIINSKIKGKVGELEFCHFMADNFDIPLQRSQQYCGVAGDADVIGLEGVHFEVKRVEKLNIDNAIEQAKNDSKDNQIPIVAHRKNRKEWLLTITATDLKSFADLFNSVLNQK